jgi:hypothetical protein
MGCAVTVASGSCCGLLSSSTSPCDVMGLTSLCRCVGESSRVSRLSRRSSVVSLSARPSRYRWLRLELWFIVFFVGGSAMGGALGESLSRRWCQGQQRGRFRMSWTSMEALVERLPIWSLIFLVKSFLRLSEGRRRRRLRRRLLLGGVVSEIKWSASIMEERFGERLEVCLELGRRRSLKLSLSFSLC